MGAAAELDGRLRSGRARRVLLEAGHRHPDGDDPNGVGVGLVEDGAEALGSILWNSVTA
jgi:hypothetical protein